MNIFDKLLDPPARSSHEPIRRLSEANIMRAKEAWEQLTPERRAKIRNKKRYIFKVAWDIQKGRQGKYHHR